MKWESQDEPVVVELRERRSPLDEWRFEVPASGSTLSGPVRGSAGIGECDYSISPTGNIHTELLYP